MAETGRIVSAWGRRPPEDVKVKAHWGARAIWTDREPYFDTLPDRQSWNDASEEDHQRLSKWLQAGAYKALEKRCQAIFSGNSGDMQTLQVVEGNFHMEANPQGSFGYMYLGAWEVDPS
jgi:hypothetical protein